MKNLVALMSCFLVFSLGCKDKSKPSGDPGKGAATPAATDDRGAPPKSQPEGEDDPAAKKAAGARSEAKSSSGSPDAKGDPKDEDPARATEKRETYRQALARGRGLIDAKKYDEAYAAFEAALAARPGDATALSELSWAAFQTEDYGGAIDAATKSAERADKDPSLGAASLYNRGRAKEALDDRSGAIADYQESYRLRPHEAVRKRLVALGADVPESVWQARALRGPFSSIEEYCRGPDRCEEGEPWSMSDIDAAKIPWAKSVSVARGGERPDDYWSVHLLFETDSGWYEFSDFERYVNRYDWGVEEMRVEGNRVVLFVTNSDGRFATDHQRHVSVCDIGPSGKPSCFGPVILRESYIGYTGSKEDGHELPEEVYFECTATLAGDRVTVTAKDKGCRQKAALVGEHTLRFL